MAVNSGKEQACNIPRNLMALRKRLRMSQKDFISAFLTGADQTPMICVATLSNMERGSTANIRKVTVMVAEKMEAREEVFSLPPEQFEKNMDGLFENYFRAHLTHPDDAHDELRQLSNVGRLVKRLTDYLTDALMIGAMQPGDMLPSDRQLGKMFGAGRTPIREALKVLSVMGLIQIYPGKGTFLASKSSDLFLAPISWALLLGEQHTESLVDVRIALGAESARLAALNAQPEQLAALTALQERKMLFYDQSDLGPHTELGVEFHMEVAKCSNNPIILRLLSVTRKLLTYMGNPGTTSLGDVRANHEEHQEIYNAIVQRDSQRAEAAMREHLTRANLRRHVMA